jgi:hypothetical protein
LAWSSGGEWRRKDSGEDGASVEIGGGSRELARAVETARTKKAVAGEERRSLTWMRAGPVEEQWSSMQMIVVAGGQRGRCVAVAWGATGWRCFTHHKMHFGCGRLSFRAPKTYNVDKRQI